MEKLEKPIVKLKDGFWLSIDRTINSEIFIIKVYDDTGKLFLKRKSKKYPIDDEQFKKIIIKELVNTLICKDKAEADKILSIAYIEIRELLDKWIQQDEKILKEFDLVDTSEEAEEYRKIKGEVIFYLEAKDRNGACFNLSRFLLDKYNIITLQETDEIFIYDKGVYYPRGDKLLLKKIQQILSDITSINLSYEVLGHIKRSTYRKFETIKEPINKICLNNGILNLDTLTTEEHNPKIIFFNKMPVDYNQNQDCPLFKKFLSEVADEDSIILLQEFIGYCLYKSYPFHKAFILLGGGSNGKSTFLRVLKEFLGIKNCVSISLQQLEKDKFAISCLFGKFANIYADLPAKALQETSCFKMLVGEDLISGEKKFKDKFEFMNYSKLIFSANQLPKSPEDTDAFFRRWIILNFPNQFIENQNADPELTKKLTTSEELSGVLNFAIDGLKKLLSNQHFSDTKSIQDVREEYIRKSDSIASFIMDHILITPDKYSEKKKLYTLYADYCRTNKYPVSPDNTFHRELAKQVRVEDYRPVLEVEGKKERVQCWKGIIYSTDKLIEKNLDNTDTKDKQVKDVKASDYYYIHKILKNNPDSNKEQIINQCSNELNIPKDIVEDIIRGFSNG